MESPDLSVELLHLSRLSLNWVKTQWCLDWACETVCLYLLWCVVWDKQNLLMTDTVCHIGCTDPNAAGCFSFEPGNLRGLGWSGCDQRGQTWSNIILEYLRSHLYGCDQKVSWRCHDDARVRFRWFRSFAWSWKSFPGGETVIFLGAQKKTYSAIAQACGAPWKIRVNDWGDIVIYCHVVLIQEISRVNCKLSRLEPTSSTKHAFIAFPPGFSMWWVCRHLWLSCGVRALGKASSEQTLLVAEILQQFLMILVEVLSSWLFKPGTVQIYQQTFRPGIDLFSPFLKLMYISS